MILVTNGCSWTYGSDLDHLSKEEREQQVWTHDLGKLLSVEKSVNLSMGCGSNDRILRTTFDYVSNQDSETLAKSLFIIQWTEPSRYEYYVPMDRNNNQENIESRWARCKIDVVDSPENENSTKLVRMSNYHISKTTDLQNAYKILFYAEAMSNLLKDFNVKFFYWGDLLDWSTFPKLILKRLSAHPWVDFYNLKKEYWDYERVSAEDSHPSRNGHRQIAQNIYRKIT